MTDAMTLHKQYLAVFDGPAGNAVLADIYRKGGLMKSTYSADTMKAAHAEGMRDLALHVYEMLDTQRQERLAERGDKKHE